MLKPDLSEFSHLPRFPDGRINYTNSAKAATINCIIRYKRKILLLKRSDKVGNYKGKWSIVAGYLDDETPIRKKALGEVREETGITEKDISTVKLLPPITIKDKLLKKIFITYISLITLKSRKRSKLRCASPNEVRLWRPKIKLDWEHTEFKWVKLKDVSKFDTIPGLLLEIERTLTN